MSTCFPAISRRQIPASVLYLWQALNVQRPAYVVGGAPRDLVMGRIPTDWDLASPLLPNALMALGARLNLRVIPTGISWGTVTFHCGNQAIEVTTFRREGFYRDHRHPTHVQFSTQLAQDLGRRDFTMNAMALRLDGGLIDPHRGLADLQAHRIATVGDPVERFAEDPLRMLRAARFTGMMDQDRTFTLAPVTEQALTARLADLHHVSAERQRDELMKALGQPAILNALVTLYRTGILTTLWPEWEAANGFDQRNPHHTVYPWLHDHLIQTAAIGSTPELRLAGLLHDIGKPRCCTEDSAGIRHFYQHASVGADMAEAMLTRLKFDRATIRRTTTLIAEHMFPWDTAGPKALARLVRRYDPQMIWDLLELRRMDLAGRGAPWPQEHLVRQTVGTLIAQHQETPWRLALSGHDIMKIRAIEPGPLVRAYIDALTRWVEDHPDQNTRDALSTHLATLDESVINPHIAAGPDPHRR